MSAATKPRPAPAGSVRLAPVGRPQAELAQIFIRDLRIEAGIGVYAAEQGRRQALMIEAILDIAPPADDNLAATVDYDAVAALARDIADGGHIGLVETFARRLALACLRLPEVRRIDLTVSKPEARAPALVGARLVMSMAGV